MCHDAESHPPAVPPHRVLPRLAGGAGADRFSVTSADGTAVSVALAETPSPQGPAVLILPDIRGLAPFYAELAERFAAAGHHAMVIDYFDRSHPLPRGEDFDGMAAVKADTEPEEVAADIAAAITELKARTGATSVVAVGFCFGGTVSYLSSADHALELDAFIAFYGGLDGANKGFPSPPDLAAQMRGPILGLFGAADKGIPVDDVNAFDNRLSEVGVTHEFVLYDGAPHAFFDRRFEQHAEACADAWERVLDFLDALALEASVA